MSSGSRCAVVTGASRGIGRGIALALAAQGWDIVINYRSQSAPAQELAQQIEAMGRKTLLVQADVSRFDEAKALIDQAAAAFGGIGVLVNNAGITRDGLLARMSEEDYDQVLDVNLKSAFNCIRHATPIMMKQRAGRIINITSVVGITGNAGQANYAASKAGVIGLTKSAARELARRGITVNAVAPGYIATDMTQAMPEAAREKVMETIPLGRAGTAEDVAGAVCFLVGPAASYITGVVLRVDGGMAI